MAPTNSNRKNAKTKRKWKTSNAVSEYPLPRRQDDDKENSSPPPPILSVVIDPKHRINELYENNWWKINLVKASTLIEKCKKSYRWDRNETKRLFASYRKFLLLKKEMADWDATRLMPCFPIDLIWQEHIRMEDYDADMRDLLGHVIRRGVPEESETTPAGGDDAAAVAAALPEVKTEEMLTKMEQTTRQALKRRFGTRHDDEIWDVVVLSFVDQLGEETIFEVNMREPLSISCFWYSEEVKKKGIDKYQFTYDGTVIPTPTSGDDCLASHNEDMTLVTLVSLGFDRHSSNTKIIATRTDKIKITIQHSSEKYEGIYLIGKEIMISKIFDRFAKELLDTVRSKLVFLNGEERVYGHESPIALGLEVSQCDIVIQAVAAELHKSKNCICCNPLMGLAEFITNSSAVTHTCGWMVRCVAQFIFNVIVLLRGLFALSFHARFQSHKYRQRPDVGMKQSISDEPIDYPPKTVDMSGINEAQLMLACSSWLLRNHKLEWKEKKRRGEAAASPLNNEGYFWPDPNDLLYLREDPDPYNLNYNETYSEYYGFRRNGVRFLTARDTTYNGKSYYETPPAVEETASISDNPFSSNPMYPSDEHTRRSNIKLRLWRNETWKEEWYNRRWRGKVGTLRQQIQKKQNKLLRGLSNDVIESPLFESMSEIEVTEAILTYIVSNQRKSESSCKSKNTREKERESFREWREQVKQAARDAPRNQTITTNMKDIARKISPISGNNTISFSPSIEAMKKLKKQRSEKSIRAFQARLVNRKSNTVAKRITLRQSSSDKMDGGNATFSPVQALLQIDEALDHGRLPSPRDIETILHPGRLGKRRETLRRILSECYDLRGKCVPVGEELLFVTKCDIIDLGLFVLNITSIRNVVIS